jgi:hypothetical protein
MRPAFLIVPVRSGSFRTQCDSFAFAREKEKKFKATPMPLFKLKAELLKIK